MTGAFIKKLLRHERETGSLAPKPANGGRARYLDAAVQAWLVAYVGQHPDANLAELSYRPGRPIAQPRTLRAVRESVLLAPTLRRGDVLVLDNLAVHKMGGLREWLAERDVQAFFLPPYSPDFALIEQS